VVVCLFIEHQFLGRIVFAAQAILPINCYTFLHSAVSIYIVSYWVLLKLDFLPPKKLEICGSTPSENMQLKICSQAISLMLPSGECKLKAGWTCHI